MSQAPTMQMPSRLPLVIGPENRDSSTQKDSRLVNCYVEVEREQKEIDIYRRPGQLLWGSPSGSALTGLGTYYWNGNVYSIFSNGHLYKDLTSVASGLDTSASYTFSSILGATPKLVFQNGAQGYSFDGTTLSATLHSINASYPQYTCKGLAYLNGAMYVLQHYFNTAITPAVVWGSKVNSVDQAGDWDPLDFITAQITPDSGVALAKQLIYVVCLKEQTTEVFFDAGNATGSPLQNVQNAKISYGCAAADSVQDINDVLFWISTQRSASNQVVMLEKLQLRVVSTPEIDRLLNQADLTTVYSWQIKANGHSFYVVTVKSINLTLAYDMSQDRWDQWTDSNGNYVPIVSSTRDTAGNHILQHESNGNLYYGSPNYRTDDGVIFPCTVITPNVDMGTRRWKHLGMLTIDGDKNTGSRVNVQFSDDDYQTWTPARIVDMSDDYPALPQCGTFRRRAFKLVIADDQAFRLRALEMQIDLGTL